MRILILAAAVSVAGARFLPAAVPAAEPVAAAAATPLVATVKFAPPSGTNCPAVSRFHALKNGEGVKAQKLGELPPADHYKAVYRTVGGCEVPVMADFNPDNLRQR
jgi:hypothetical protein